MTNDLIANRTLEVELESLLREISPDESPYASQYLENWDEKSARTGRVPSENIFGTPAGGVELLVGQLLAAFVIAIAKDVLSKMKDKALDQGATAGLEWIKGRFKTKKPATISGREETVKSITATLVQAGWTEARAMKAAEKVWLSGAKTATLLAGQSLRKP